jgi:hypothetical protein
MSAEKAGSLDFASAHRLWSLWDMVTLDARRFVNTVLGLSEMERYLSKNPSTLSPQVVQTLHEMSSSMAADCDQLHLKVAADGARGIPNAETTRDLERTLEFVRQAMVIGLNGRKFFEPEPNYIKYFENPKLFGDAVITAFPSAIDDISEAVTCLALERSTACVMHLMRVVEVGLKSLAKTVGVVTRQNDWGAYIREIDKELATRMKVSGKHTADEAFYAESSAQFGHVKTAWRNSTMHVQSSYSQARAEEILFAVKSFMAHLATKISE